MNLKHGRPTRKWNRTLFFRVIPSILILSGVILILFVFFAKREVQDRQDSLYAAYQAMVSEGPAQLPNQESVYSEENLPPFLPGVPEAKADSNTDAALLPVCLLRIPKIDLEVVVAEGIGESSLSYAVGHFQGTALPGGDGNFCLAGHRSYVYNQFFNRLDEMEVGDPICVEWYGKEITYTVTEILVVEPDDTWVLYKTQKPSITLVTCTPIRVGTHRLIVRGELYS